MRIGPRDFSHWTLRTTLAPDIGNTWRSTVNFVSWMSTVMASHRQLHSNCWPFPTITRKGVVARGDRPNWVTNWCWMKLCVLPPSTSNTTWWSLMRPRKWSVSGATLPARELKLIWVGYGSTVSGGSRGGSLASILDREGSSSSVMRRKTLEAQRWPLWYFSS